MKNLKTVSDAELIQQIRRDAAQERTSGLAVIHLLREVALRRLDAQLGHDSLFEYCVKDLKYSRGSAWRRIASMKALGDMPELEVKIAEGELTLANLSQVQSFCEQNGKTVEEKKEIFEQCSGLSKRDTEKKLAEIAPQPEKSEKKRELDGKKTELRITLDAETVAVLDKIRDLISHSRPNASYAQVIAHLAKMGLMKLDPAAEKAPRKTSCPPGDKIPLAVRRAVWKRDGGKCGYVSPEGRCCGSTKRVQCDHIVPRAMGGGHEPGNLRLRCRAHNLWAAIEELGMSKMDPYLAGF